jgi:hypothetical protein
MAAMVRARARWVVTGTPIGSGGLTDLHGLLRVLQHDPFQDRQLWHTCIAKPYARGGTPACLPYFFRNCITPPINTMMRGVQDESR